jgi:hypothetical protein
MISLAAIRRRPPDVRPSLRRTEIESQGGQRIPREVNIRVWIVIIAIIGLLAWFMLS